MVRPNGQILITDWGVKGGENTTPALHRIVGGETGSVMTIDLPEWQGPADFDCADTYGCWIPDLPGSAVHVVRPADRTN